MGESGRRGVAANRVLVDAETSPRGQDAALTFCYVVDSGAQVCQSIRNMKNGCIIMYSSENDSRAQNTARVGVCACCVCVRVCVLCACFFL